MTTRGYLQVTTPDDDRKLFDCPVLTALGVIAGKWKTRILWLLRERPYHFGELRRRLPGVSAKVLAAQLQELEADGLIERNEERRDAVVFVRYSYSDYGRRQMPVLDMLAAWGLEIAGRRVEEGESAGRESDGRKMSGT
ncbi:winged helix-turn-helix transcriptional regulator [Rhizobium halophytocola]|uniref:DNA-binding HxlR family transcriptional regulator n=1 Tax=Rhizobium halophytocola TaxID=735519 RepID=A0ABS4DWE8_9HYPH|nr:helix-turn-helix domain-containing protein [Rhizobium halophytocola]MBP1850000.1 DNA-binding HxlR family transcriptional regulator [Rhizobium halophytocola]